MNSDMVFIVICISLSMVLNFIKSFFMKICFIDCKRFLIFVVVTLDCSFLILSDVDISNEKG
jgi:succinate-acetate transporter protein